MSGSSIGGESLFSKSAAVQFESGSVESLQQAVASGLDKEELREAAMGAISKLESELNAHQTESLKGKYLELAEKFAKLFPEDKKDLSHINDFAHSVLGIVKDIGPEEAKPINYEDLPEGVSLEETWAKLKDSPVGEIYLRKSGDNTSLVIAMQTGITDKYKDGVMQLKFPSAGGGKFIDDITGEAKTIEELVSAKKEWLEAKIKEQTPPTKIELKEGVISPEIKSDELKNVAFDVDKFIKKELFKNDTGHSKILDSINSEDLKNVKVPVADFPKFDFDPLKEKLMLIHLDAVLSGMGIQPTEVSTEEVKTEVGISAPPKPPEEAKAKTVNFPKMIEDVKVLSVTLGGTTGAKLVEADGQKFVKKTGIPGKATPAGGDQAAHVSSEYHTNKVYQALGVPVPTPMIYHTTTTASIKGELPPEVNSKDVTSTVMLSEFIESTSWDEYMKDPKISAEQKEQTKEMLREHFVLDCLLGNYDVMGHDRDNIRVTKEGVPYRIDNGSGLENTAQGKLKKPEFWGKTVTEIDSLRNTGHPKTEVRNAAEIYKDVTDDMIRDQVADLVSNKGVILAALPEKYHEVIGQRLEYLQSRFPPASAFDKLPILTSQETYEQLKDKPVGSVLARKSSADPGHLVIAYKKEDGGPPNYGVGQAKLAPGSDGKFILEGKEYKIDELVNMYKEKYTPKLTPEQLVAASLKAGVPKNAGEADALNKNLKEAFKGKGIFFGQENYAVDFVRNNIKPLSAIMNGNLDEVSENELLQIEEGLKDYGGFPIPKEIKEGAAAIREKFEKHYSSDSFDPKPLIENALSSGKTSSEELKIAAKFGADTQKIANAGKEIALSKITDNKISKYELENILNRLEVIVPKATGGTKTGVLFLHTGAFYALADKRENINAAITGSKTLSETELEELISLSNLHNTSPLGGIFLDAATKGYEAHFKAAAEKFAETLKSEELSPKKEAPKPKKTLFNGLPVLTSKETYDALKNEPINTVLARRSSDPSTSDQLVIAVKAGDGPAPSYGVKQYKLEPGAEKDTFVLGSTGEFTIDELLDHYSGKTPLTGAAAAKPPSAAEIAIIDFKNLKKFAELSKTPIPESVMKEFSEKVLLPPYKEKASPALLKVLDGKVSELSFEELEKIPAEIASFGDLPVPEQASLPSIVDAVIKWVDTHKSEINSNPSLATRAHLVLHELAQKEIAAGNVRRGFEIEAKAATAIPLSATHPLHKMDEAILQGTARQYDAKTGAHFSSLDTSIVKGGNLHAAQRKIDGKLTNTFDFKISHYARDELTVHVDAIINNQEEFKASVPKELAASVKINQNVDQEFLRYDDSTHEFTRSGGYSPGNSKATEIVFEGVGKIIIGNTKKNGTMYNRIQVEMNPNLPPGEGAKKLQQMLAVTGLGPVLGEQPPEADERMKIAQLFRAYYPQKCTAMDTTKEFYQLPIDELKKKIIAKEPGMAAIFTKYLDTNPELMQKVEIIPGKEIWGVKDLGAQMKAKGAWGLMTGVGNSGGWDSAKTAVVRMLTQGAMSSEQRFESGVYKHGASSEDDLMSGGGDQVFTRLVNNNTGKGHTSNFPFHGNAQILWDLDSVAQRVPYGYDADKYGVKNRFKPAPTFFWGGGNSYEDYKSRPSLLELASGAFNAGNEIMAKNSLDPSHVAGVVVESNSRKVDLINHLVKEGLAEKDSGDGLYYVKFAGKRIKADDFIHVGSKFKKEWWG